MEDKIKHVGTVDRIENTSVWIKIIQTSACSGCSAQGHCSSSECKEKTIQVVDTTNQYKVGDKVLVEATVSMGMLAVLLAFVIPFCVLVASLFTLMYLTNNDELYSSLTSLGIVAVYYIILYMNKRRTSKKFSFTIKPIK